jgi:hypothetical protein
MPRKRIIIAVIAIVFAAAGVGVLKGAFFARDFVRTQLAEQQIAFPTVAADRTHYAAYPELKKYAGRAVTDGWTAHAYANLIDHHVAATTGGKSYSQVSSQAIANPNNAALQQARRTALDGQLLRGTLLNVYGWWWIGTLALWAGWTLVGFAGALLIGLTVPVLRGAVKTARNTRVVHRASHAH